MKTGMEESVCVFGSGALLRGARAMQEETTGVRQGGDIEYVHRMRVASRRLRTALALFGGCLPAKKLVKWEKEVRSITRALGAARDTDVQLALLQAMMRAAPLPEQRPGLRRLALRLWQKRERMQKKVVKALNALESAQTLAQIRAAAEPLAARQGEVYIYTPGLYHLGYQSISAALDAFLAFESIIWQPEKVQELHAMRIAAKHLRYSLESFAALYPDELKPFIGVMRKAQELLGDIHDSDVWTTYLPQFREEETARIYKFYGTRAPAKRLEPGLAYFAENRARFREETYAKFLESWIEWQNDSVWDALRKTINLPFFHVERVTPNPRRKAQKEAPATQQTTQEASGDAPV